MQSYSDICTDQTRPVKQAVENAESELSRARQSLLAGETSRTTLDERLQETHQQLRDLDSPRSSVKAELLDLESRIRDLQRQVDGKQGQLRAIEDHAERLIQEIRKSKADIAAASAELQRASEDVRRREAVLADAHGRLRAARLRALQSYCADVFEGLRRRASEASSREAFELKRAAYEHARHNDKEIMSAHEQRIELKRHLESSQEPTIRELLLQHLRRVEDILESRFPGILQGPPPPDEDELLETFFWYEPADDLTSLLLPLPASCWHTPPDVVDDPRGELTCRILWAFERVLGDPVAHVECEQELVKLEFHGDQSSRIGDSVFEVGISSGRKASFLPTPLPVELREALA